MKDSVVVKIDLKDEKGNVTYVGFDERTWNLKYFDKKTGEEIKGLRAELIRNNLSK